LYQLLKCNLLTTGTLLIVGCAVLSAFAIPQSNSERNWWLAMDSNHPRRLYESRVLPTELASRCSLNLAGRAGFEPAHSVSNSHVPSQLGYRPRTCIKNQKAPTFVGAFENLNLNLECYGQTNPEGRTRLTRRLIVDLTRIIIAKMSIACFQRFPAVF
jgi:hypothetical protein